MNQPSKYVEGIYRGRFAPSPTGDLHLGSLLAAVASFLEARSHGGEWLVRIEDLDPPRMMVGAASRILRLLESHGLCWDGAVRYQHDRTAAYETALAYLQAQRLIYPCACTRKEVAQIARAGIDGPVYPGTCRAGLLAGRVPRAWRLQVGNGVTQFNDAIQGLQSQQLAQEIGDFVLRRADGLFAYQLAVVIDDTDQKINHVVRGADLLASTPRQIYLLQSLGVLIPEYAHIPVLVNETGEKLSKQALAKPLREADAVSNIWFALNYLGQKPPLDLHESTLTDIWQWALVHWRLDAVPQRRSLPVRAAGTVLHGFTDDLD